jgi:hypothetical protein
MLWNCAQSFCMQGHSMPLVNLDLSIEDCAIPDDVRAFLREAERRIEQFQRDSRVPGFVASDFEQVYRVLRTVAAADLTPGKLFCEWGSGFGVVACLAALLDFDACGIEIDLELVEAARQLAGDFDLPVEFVCGSFIPRGANVSLNPNTEFAWLTTEADSAHDELDLATDDFSVVFAYPWPDEEQTIDQLFDHYATLGAILITYHGGCDFQLRQKRSKPARRG